MGVATYHELVAQFGSARHAFDAAPGLTGHSAALESADAVLVRAERAGARMILPDDAEFPQPLRDLDHLTARNLQLSPPFLFAIGRTETLRTPVVAIVGTRRATPYGERVTFEIAHALARAGATIVSGLARGIDATAHRAALAATGTTVAVLGTGVDIAYPPAHRALHAEIAAKGLLLSEELPGERANGGSFPKRNRIIAALAELTVVTEAPVRSGALITAQYALDLGRTIAVVPGAIDSPQSAGSNALFGAGAQPITNVDDALGLIHAAPAKHTESALRTPAERAIWDALARGAADIDLLTARTGLPARECLAAVTGLELAGAISCALTGEIRRR